MVNVEKARAQLEQASSIDLLTGLLNRRGLAERAAGLFRSLERDGRRAAVLFADLDGFKAVNDACGHHVGDGVLREFAAQLRRSLRDTDVAARFGGDEFVVVLPDATLEQARAVAERLKAIVAALAQDDRFSLRLSVGAGEVPRDGRDLAGILAHVDTAMYEDKLSHTGTGARRGNGTSAPGEGLSPAGRGSLHHDVPG
jgi:diguanylate cyclase (GGDEF)-like protein